MKQIYLLKWTKDDGKTWKLSPNEFFTKLETAQNKVKRLNEDLPELSRYEVTEVHLSWDEEN